MFPNGFSCQELCAENCGKTWDSTIRWVADHKTISDMIFEIFLLPKTVFFVFSFFVICNIEYFRDKNIKWNDIPFGNRSSENLIFKWIDSRKNLIIKNKGRTAPKTMTNTSIRNFFKIWSRKHYPMRWDFLMNDSQMEYNFIWYFCLENNQYCKFQKSWKR